VTAQPIEQDDAYFAGYLRGMEAGTASGHAAGYAEGLAVLDDAAGALAQTKPSKAVEWAAARSRRDTYQAPAKSAAEIRIEAAQSWDLPVPTDVAADLAADELTDDDDLALQT
jgi:hypothetical protein